MQDIRHRKLESVTWIPLRAGHPFCVGRFGYVGFRKDWFGTKSLAVPADKRSHALTLGWNTIGIGRNHAGYVDDGRYVSADLYEDFDGKFNGVHMVLG